jgi:long-chain fatty acid transport protein
MYAPPNPVKGKNPLSNVQLLSGGQTINAGVDAGDQDITLDMRQFELTVGVNYTY